MLILPIRTSIKPQRTPYVNYALIVLNVIIFLFTYLLPLLSGSGDTAARNFMLIPLKPELWQFVTYAFLHGGFMHIIGNMFFLYLFGNNVNDKLGNIGYLSLYLAGAVFSGIGHTLISGTPVLGASGAVAAVTGAYLVLFPQTLVTVFFWIFYFIDTIEVSALYFIGFKLIFMDNMIVRYTDNVAYDAHLSGYAFGILAMLGMLATGLIKTTHFDLWSMLKHWNRRRHYHSVVASGYDPFSGTNAKKVRAKEVKKSPALKEKESKIRQLRSEVDTRIAQRNLPGAAQSYLELVEIDNKQLAPQQHLLDIANQLASESKYTESAQAYEKFLAHYAKYEYIEQVQLMLGIIYSRYLGQSESAIKYLTAAAKKLTDPNQLIMCNDELKKLEN